MTNSNKFTHHLADSINQLLPQTQCTKCGYAGCKPYAEAIANGTASHNQCPPGGQEGIERLAALLNKPVLELDPENGIERPRPLAVIDETQCIGCTLCIQACPVDAIVGAPKQMHTVIAALCTGCDLCVPPCPVDCITMVPITGTATGWQAWTQEQANAARTRHEQHLKRRERTSAASRVRLTKTKSEEHRQDQPSAPIPSSSADTPAHAHDPKQALIRAALARARQYQQAATSLREEKIEGKNQEGE